MDVDDLANEIRRIDGNKDTAASVLAEKLMPFLRAERLAGLREALGLVSGLNGQPTSAHWGMACESIAVAISARISHLEKGGE